GDARNDELRRGPWVRPHGERERSLHGVTVDGDRAPVDEVPAFRDVLQGHDERVGVRGRASYGAGGDLMAVHVADGDDREPRLDRLVERQLHRRRRRVQRDARRRHGLHQVRVCGRGGRDDERRQHRRYDREPFHASSLPPFATSASPPTTMPSAPRTIATIDSVDEPPPPPSELFTAIAGAGFSPVSGSVQFTIDPSEYVCCTWNV